MMKRTKSRMRKLELVLIAALIMLTCAACVDNKPTLIPGVTPEPTEVPVVITPRPTETPEPATEAPTAEPAEEIDAFGERITGADHFTRYLLFRDLVVYEEGGDTFLDGIVENSYPMTITCEVEIVYNDGFGRELARARLQTRDGSYLLSLKPGETVVFARILTDMTLTDMDFELVFNLDAGVTPIKDEN